MTTTFEIQNLKCCGCAHTIFKKLSSIGEISEVIVDNDSNTVSFWHQDDYNIMEVKETLSKLGYPVVGDNNALTTKAKSYVSCAMGKMNA